MKKLLNFLLIILLFSPKLIFPQATSFDFPVKPINNWWVKDQNEYRFGDKRDWGNGIYGYHGGEDWNLKSGNDTGQPVYAVADGIITKKNLISGGTLGSLLIIKHTPPSGTKFNVQEVNGTYYHYQGSQVNSVSSVYMHIIPLSTMYESKPVFKGEQIGTICNLDSLTAGKMGSHLHFEIRLPNARWGGGSIIYISEKQDVNCYNSLYHTNTPADKYWTMTSANGCTITGDYTDMQKAVEAGLINPSKFIEANTKIDGAIDISSGITISPVQVKAGQNFTTSFSVKETKGFPVTYKTLICAIHNTTNGNQVFDMDARSNILIAANGTYNYTSTKQWSTSYPPGKYQAIAKIQNDQGEWINIFPSSGGRNQVQFDVIGAGNNSIQIYSVEPSIIPELGWGESAIFTITVKDNYNNPLQGVSIAGSDYLQQIPLSAPSITNSSGQTTYTTKVRDGTNLGTYNLIFLASKTGYESSNLITRQVKVINKNQTITVSYNLPSQMSAISFPFIPPQTTFAQIFSSFKNDLSQFFFWMNKKGQFEYGDINTTPVVPLRGYLINLSKTNSIAVTGVKYTGEVKLYKGWNLFGTNSTSLPNRDNRFDESAYQLQLQSNPPINAFNIFQNGLQLGQAYFNYCFTDSVALVYSSQNNSIETVIKKKNALKKSENLNTIKLDVENGHSGSQLLLGLDKYLILNDSESNNLAPPPLPASIYAYFKYKEKLVHSYKSIEDSLEWNLSIVSPTLDFKGEVDNSPINIAFDFFDFQFLPQYELSIMNGNNDEVVNINSNNVFTVYPKRDQEEFNLTIKLKINKSIIETNKYSMPNIFQLYQNYPNPFNPTTTIGYYLEKNCDVQFNVYDLIGSKINASNHISKSAGYHEFNFNGQNLTTGFYLYQVVIIPQDGSKSFSISKKMLLIK